MSVELPGRRKTAEEIHGCSEGGHPEGWHERRGCKGQGQMKADDLLWRLLKIPSERKRGRRMPSHHSGLSCFSSLTKYVILSN